MFGQYSNKENIMGLVEAYSRLVALNTTGEAITDSEIKALFLIADRKEIEKAVIKLEQKVNGIYGRQTYKTNH